MKNARLFCLLGLSWSCLLTVSAQDGIRYMQRNDSLILNIGEYKDGSIQWQRSTNLTSWNNITGATGSILRYKIPNPYYIRAKVTETDCEPLYTDTLQINFAETWSGSTYKLNGGRAYVHPYVSSGAGLRTSESGSLSSWTNAERKAVWYIYQQKGLYELSYIMNLTAGSTRNFNITCTQANGDNLEAPVTNEFSHTGTGKSDTVFALSINIPATGYYRYELESKNTAGSITISALSFKGISVPGLNVSSAPHTTDYLSSPSVHLTFSSSTVSSGTYDWFYQEVLVPEGYDPLASYYMAIGFSGGYCGIQTNSNTERRMLFSVWDQIDADAYNRNGIPLPQDSLVSLVDKASYTQANGFGNEGTGGQSYVGTNRIGTWTTGTPVKVLYNKRIQHIPKLNGEGNKPTAVISVWYKASEEEGWRYIATWRRPYVSSYDTGFHSFLENYGWTNGHLPRKAYYYNSFGRNVSTGAWVHFNKAGFSHTDGSAGQRVDYEQGVAEEDPTKFYMLSGGYNKTKLTGTQLPVQPAPAELTNPDFLSPFIARVDEALENEQKSKE
jgi:hypothetical protein